MNHKKKGHTDILVPDEWEPYIVDRYNNETPSTNTVKMIQKDLRIKKKWRWLIKNDNTSRFIVFTMEMMTELPIINKSRLLFYYLQENYGEFTVDKKIENRVIKSFTGALTVLSDCNLIETMNVEPTQKGRFTCCFYIAPFAREEDKNKAIKNYINIGGGVKTVKKRKTKNDYEKSADREIEYRDIVKRKIILRKVVKDKNDINKFPYECSECNKAYSNRHDLSEVCKDCFDKGKIRSLVSRTVT